jgi:tripartite ATP-independent transporter DctP family solute receptor
VGAIDLDRTNVAPMGSFVPEANVLALPFLFRSLDHLYRVLDGPVGQDILASFEPHGFIGLSYYDSGARSIYNSVRPVRTLADLKGMRIRVQQSDLMVDMIKALGAEAVAMPYGQVLTGLTNRLIDGAENNWPSYVTTNHYTAARYYTMTEHTMSPEVLVMSRKAWDSLSPEDQAIFRAAAQESGRFMRQQWKDWEERSREQARKGGVAVERGFDRKPFMDAMAGIYEAALRDPKVKDLVDRIRHVE